MSSFFFCFFQLTISLWVVHFSYNSAQKANFTPKGPPFSFYFFKETYTTGRAQRVPPLDFFRHCATFFRKFLKFIKGYPLAFFWNFRFVENVEWAWMAFFLSFSAFCDLKNTFFRKKNSKIIFLKNFFFQIFTIVVPWIFLSLRYGADLGRSRLVFLQTTILTLICPLFRNNPETT